MRVIMAALAVVLCASAARAQPSPDITGAADHIAVGINAGVSQLAGQVGADQAALRSSAAMVIKLCDIVSAKDASALPADCPKHAAPAVPPESK
jgi:hypothetical protein